MKRHSKRKACASVSSEARTAENPPQQPLETLTTQLDVNLSTSSTFPTPSLPLASAAAASPESQRSSNMQISGSGEKVPTQAQLNNDPFSNMRLDTDNMSYEELLALQEQIGYVSTGLSGKELIKARKRSIYRAKRRKTTKHTEVDSICSICQEEYVCGDKLGTLKCKHRYHVICIEQWLGQKNWCPTCKTDARACS